jgi:hypothetical protein
MTDQQSLPSFTTADALHPLHLLDQILVDFKTKQLPPDKKQDEILRAADFLLGGSLLDGALTVLDSSPSTIRHLCSPHRNVHLVQGSAQGGNRKKCVYYCQTEGIVYCSCRSYFERAKVDPKAICKHLVALKLMPHFSTACCTKEQVSDRDFGTISMLRAFND